jgi:hypothetical protein
MANNASTKAAAASLILKVGSTRKLDVRILVFI